MKANKPVQPTKEAIAFSEMTNIVIKQLLPKKGGGSRKKYRHVKFF